MSKAREFPYFRGSRSLQSRLLFCRRSLQRGLADEPVALISAPENFIALAQNHDIKSASTNEAS